MTPYPHNFLIVSDFHLSEGFLPQEGKYATLEDFTSDDQFLEFLRYYQTQRQQHNGRPWKLIFAGDLFDFLQVTSTPGKSPANLEVEIQKLEHGQANGFAPANIHAICNPVNRKSQIINWLQLAEETSQEKRENERFTQLSECICRMKNLAQNMSNHCLWHLERLALEAQILAATENGELADGHLQRGLGTSWFETVWKLDRIFEGHPVFFEALAEFLVQGNSLTLLRGNHDVELFWPQVKTRFTELLVDAHQSVSPHAKLSSGTVQTQVEFLPWIYFEPGLFYLEHGNQYEPANAFDSFIKPTLKNDDNYIQLPPGSFLVRYLFNQVEALVPFADNLRPHTRFIAWMVKNNLPLSCKIVFCRMRQFLRFVWRLASRGVVNYYHLLRQRGQISKLSPVILNASARSHLKPELLQEIKNFADKLSSKVIKKLINYLILLAPGLIVVALYVVPVLVFLGSWISHIGSPYILTAVFTLLGFLLRRLLAPVLVWLISGDNFLEEAARGVNDILRANGQEVKYLIFGHNHDADLVKLTPEQAGSPWYVNTGTWLPYDMDEDRWNQIEKTFSYLQIIPDQLEPAPGLYRWQPEQQQPERIRLRHS